MPLPPGLISAVIESDFYPLRFELFVIDLLSAEDGHTYVSTSRNYDRGRDGRSVMGSDTAQHIIAATTSRSLDEKVLNDIKTLVSTTSIASLTYCCSLDLTEHAIDGISAVIRNFLPKEALLRVFARQQLSDLVSRHENVLERHYSRELADLRSFLSTPATDEKVSNVGLRLALQTQVGDDAVMLRQEVCSRLLLEQLLDGKHKNINELAVGLSGRLHLPRVMHSGFLDSILRDLIERRLVGVHSDRYSLNEEGRAFLSELGEQAATRLFEGKQAVREAIDELLGYQLPELEYERLWPVFRDGIAHLFHVHGAAIIDMVSSLHENSSVVDDKTFRVAREVLGDRVSMLFANEEQRLEVRQAIIDLFSRRGTRAFEWLSSVCVVYVMMCSLGIESRSAQEVGRTLQGMTLLADTDVLLSLLCEGEEKNSEIRQVLNGWYLMGGKVAAPTPALEEVAYHAWIANQEYLESRDVLKKIADDRAEYIVNNAFVRTFRKLSPDVLNQRLWTQYIQEYQGRTKYDHSKIVEILVHEFHVNPVGSAISEADATSDHLYSSIRRFLLEHTAEGAGCAIDELDDIAQDKARRDAILLTQLAILRQRLRQAASSSTMIVISSARGIRRAGTHFKNDFDRPDAVVTIPAVATLLALTPGVGMGVQSLKSLLFDARLVRRLSSLEQFAYRVLEHSGQYTLGLSRRVTLHRRLREELVAQAQRTGRRPREEEAELMSGKDPAGAVRVVGGALRNMAISSDTEVIIVAQQRRIRELEAELNTLRAQG